MNVYDSPEWAEWADRVRADLLPKLQGSGATVSIVPDGEGDVKFAVELGLSIHTLVCDGCGQQFGMDVCYGSAIEARAAAYGDGWRFPEKIRKTRGESKSVSDVCPKCTHGWEASAGTGSVEEPASGRWVRWLTRC